MIFLFGMLCFLVSVALLPFFDRSDDFFALSLCLLAFFGVAVMIVSPIYYAIRWAVSWFM